MRELYLAVRRMQARHWENPMTASRVWDWVKAVNRYCIKTGQDINKITVY